MSLPVSMHCLFNRKLVEFFLDLKPVIGGLPEYAVALSSVKMLQNVDERKNQAMFDAYVARPYGPRILASDVTFFLSTEYGGAGNMGVVQLVKDAWQGMSDADKDAVWAHLKVLMVLNDRCNAAKCRT